MLKALPGSFTRCCVSGFRFTPSNNCPAAERSFQVYTKRQQRQPHRQTRFFSRPKNFSSVTKIKECKSVNYLQLHPILPAVPTPRLPKGQLEPRCRLGHFTSAGLLLH